MSWGRAEGPMPEKLMRPAAGLFFGEESYRVTFKFLFWWLSRRWHN